MADRSRLAAAGLFLALVLAAVPALLPNDLAGVDSNQRAEAAAPAAPILHLRVGDLTPPQEVAQTATEPTTPPEGVLRLTVAETAPRSHTVVAGETLWRISQEAGVGVEALAAADHLTGGVLQRAGEATPAGPIVHLRVGDLTPPQEIAQGATEPTTAPEGVLRLAVAETAPRAHTVVAGETLWRISQEAAITVEALAAANHLTVGSLLHPGQVLVFPQVDPESAKAPVLTHEVAAGETLWGISRATGVRVENLAAANRLSLGMVLHPGQALVIPSQTQNGPSPSVDARPLRYRNPALPSGAPRLTFENSPLQEGSWPLVQPSDGMVTSRFGWRTHPIFGTREFHTGLDIANRIGTPVRAAESGIVRFVGWMAGYGRLIVIAHSNGLETSYSHLSAMVVSLGQRVGRGQVLGRMGSTGWSTGPHLLFEVRRNGVAVDPVPFLQGMKGTVTAVVHAAPSSRTVAATPPAGGPRDQAVSGPRVPAAVPVVPAPPVAAPGSVPTAADVPSQEHHTEDESLPSPSRGY